MIAPCYHRPMGQMLIRQLDDAAIARLKARARERKTSAEALAREAIHKAAELTAEEKRQLVARMQQWAHDAVCPAFLRLQLST